MFGEFSSTVGENETFCPLLLSHLSLRLTWRGGDGGGRRGEEGGEEGGEGGEGEEERGGRGEREELAGQDEKVGLTFLMEPSLDLCFFDSVSSP